MWGSNMHRGNCRNLQAYCTYAHGSMAMNVCANTYVCTPASGQVRAWAGKARSCRVGEEIWKHTN